MGMGFARTWLRQVSPPPLLHKTTLTTDLCPSSPSTYVHVCTLFVSFAVFIYYFNCISFDIRLSGRKVAIKLIDWLIHAADQAHGNDRTMDFYQGSSRTGMHGNAVPVLLKMHESYRDRRYSIYVYVYTVSKV